ncbi:AI-2E family transporter [Chromobacterium haemolyticum]|uniref:AI-2E family transporter n=1 Tax=Chromobacterium haemolyticum TaxID=394935 RepID=UPI001747A53B|nr:AI-2E family transporter [Chromobacterium haemolyticum]QOD83713.1 AI-2E family transporter [Chromobacterium haemolyticum]
MKRSQNRLIPWVIGATALLFAGWLLQQLAAALTPFVVAAVLAYVLNPAMRCLAGKGLPRPLAAGLLTLAGMAATIALLLVVAPMLFKQTQGLIDRLPVLADFAQGRVLPWLRTEFAIHLELDAAGWKRVLAANAGALKGALSAVALRATQSGFMLAGLLFNLLLLPVLLFYFLQDGPRMAATLATLVPRRWAGEVESLAGELDRVLGEFLRGQLSVMLIMALIFASSLALLGLESGIAIGVVAGLLVFIPYLGTFLGFALAGLAAALQFDSAGDVLLVLGVFGAGQLLESFLITPWLVGERIGLSPVAVIFSLLAFGQLLGFAGLLLALPMAAATFVICRFLARAYFNTRFYQRKIRNRHQNPV